MRISDWSSDVCSSDLVRETIEEAGIAVGLDPLPDPDALGRLRPGLNAHGSFADLLANEGLALDPDALIPFARWCPRLAHVRIFDTRFYLARLPDGAPDPVVEIGRAACRERGCLTV